MAEQYEIVLVSQETDVALTQVHLLAAAACYSD